jgi:hypothetical protein
MVIQDDPWLVPNELGEMDPKTVRDLEGDIEQAIAEVILRMGLKRLPLLPSRRTMHLMAKAAVAVYEAVIEEIPPRQEHHDEQRPEP